MKIQEKNLTYKIFFLNICVEIRPLLIYNAGWIILCWVCKSICICLIYQTCKKKKLNLPIGLATLHDVPHKKTYVIIRKSFV